MDKQKLEDYYFERNSTIFSEMLDEDENYHVISKEAWKQYLALDEIGNELECTRYKAMYLAGATDYEKLSK